MDHPKRSVDKSEALHIDLHNKGESPSFSVHRNHSFGNEPFVPSPGSSVGASVSMFSSRNSEIGDPDDTHGIHTILLHTALLDLIHDKEVRERYPGFHQYLVTEQPTWFEPAPLNGKSFRVPQKTSLPENQKKVAKTVNLEMLDLMFRFFREKHINAIRKRENKDLMETNKKIQIAAVQMFAKAEQEEECISNTLLKKIQQLNQDKDNLIKKYQKDEESLTNSLMANVAKIPEVHADETQRMMADKQAEIVRLRTICTRTEQTYQQELMRLRAEKVEHESALEQEQEMLINTLGKRMTSMTEEKRKMQQTLEQAYLRGFVHYDETVEAALQASATNKNGTSVPLPKPASEPQPPSETRQPSTEASFFKIENKRLVGMYNMEKRRSEASAQAVKKLTSRLAKMEATINSIRPECFISEGSSESRLSKAGSSPPTNVVRAQPSSSSRSSHTPNHDHAPAAPVAAAPILAAVMPIQRMRNEAQ